MPGFKINNGGGDADAKVESNRKHRWKFSLESIQQECVYLASAQRPHFIADEVIMHHDQEQVYFAGKHHWDPITLVFYDVYGGNADTSSKIWNWINECIKINEASANTPSSYKKNADLQMTNAAGAVRETWKIYNTWAIDANFNDLDYSVSEIATIDVSMKYDRASRQ
jgi:phage tail-like protein